MFFALERSRDIYFLEDGIKVKIPIIPVENLDSNVLAIQPALALAYIGKTAGTKLASNGIVHPDKACALAYALHLGNDCRSNGRYSRPDEAAA